MTGKAYFETYLFGKRLWDLESKKGRIWRLFISYILPIDGHFIEGQA
jgi:hypothetical protein